jgi:tRNA1(Val) A37 N6-methylase TrmN6
VLLSEFVSTKKGDTVVDLGTGCGIIPLILLLTRPIRRAIGLEIQPALADQAARNAVLNGFCHRMDIILGDLRSLPLKSSSADLVICNPPYRPRGSGRLNPDHQRAVARHEITASIEDILHHARLLLKPKGRFALILPAFRLSNILAALRQIRLEPKRLRIVYPTPRSEAKLVLLESISGGRAGIKILPPIFNQGNFSIRNKS